MAKTRTRAPRAAAEKPAEPATREPSAGTTPAIDASLARDLLAVIGKPVRDAKAVLARAQLPIGKRTDKQANGDAGIAYMAANRTIGGKPVLAVTGVEFYADKETSYIRGLGADVQFRGYPAPIVLGLRVTSTRAEVTAAFGPPNRSTDECDYWYPDVGRTIAAWFTPTGALRWIDFALLHESRPPPPPPFGPSGVF